MNFLAHAYLSGGDRDLLVGNLLADFLRGRSEVEALPEGVRRGVALHRRIDAFTDAHPATRRTVDRLKPQWGRYSPILADVFYDHYLARDWTQHSTVPLRQFADRVYSVLRMARSEGIAKADIAVRIIAEPDRLVSYATLEGMHDALRRISANRLRHDVHLERSVDDLRALDAEIGGDFDELFLDLVDGVRQWMEMP